MDSSAVTQTACNPSHNPPSELSLFCHSSLLMKVLNRITCREKISLAIPSKPDSEALDYILREIVQSVIANFVVIVLRSSFTHLL